MLPDPKRAKIDYAEQSLALQKENNDLIRQLIISNNMISQRLAEFTASYNLSHNIVVQEDVPSPDDDITC